MALLFHIQRPALIPYAAELNRFIRGAARYPVVANYRLLYIPLRPASCQARVLKGMRRPGDFGHCLQHRSLRNFSRDSHMRPKRPIIESHATSREIRAERAAQILERSGT